MSYCALTIKSLTDKENDSDKIREVAIGTRFLTGNSMKKKLSTTADVIFEADPHIRKVEIRMDC